MSSEFNVKDYWEARYASGRTSGAGSYGLLGEFKVKELNKILSAMKCKSVVDIGCGDGTIANSLIVPSYTGVDISSSAIELCKATAKDNRKIFRTMEEFMSKPPHNKFDVSLSLDVLYHLVDNSLFEEHLQLIFSISKKAVIIYSSDHEQLPNTKEHVLHRKFTEYISDTFPEWTLAKVIENKYRYARKASKRSSANFYIYVPTQ